MGATGVDQEEAAGAPSGAEPAEPRPGPVDAAQAAPAPLPAQAAPAPLLAQAAPAPLLAQAAPAPLIAQAAPLPAEGAPVRADDPARARPSAPAPRRSAEELEARRAAAAEALTLDDAALRAQLLERDQEEELEARAIARSLEAGDDCPVCGAPLDVTSWAILGVVRRRPALRCAKCLFEASAVPNHLGWLLLTAVALAIAGAGVWWILEAQREAEAGPRTGRMVLGVVKIAVGVVLGWNAEWGAGNTQLLAARIVRGRRRRAGEPDDEHLHPGPISENLEAVVVAIVLALVIRHAAMEAFVIPTGSMAPTLLGDHVELTCPKCDYTFAVGKAEGDLEQPGDVRTFTARCPLCEEGLTQDMTRDDVQGGNKILVNKFVYEARAPRRWEVIVFKFPRTPWKNYIKRLIGLPGDRVEVRNGDVWIDGRLARKPDEVQDAIWLPVHDARYPRADRPAWEVVEDDAHPLAKSDPPSWTFGDDRLLVEGEDPPWVELWKGVRDDVGYNTGWSSRHDSEAVADLRVRATVSGSEGSVVRLAIAESFEELGRPRTRVVSVSIPVGPPGRAVDGLYQLEVDGQPPEPPRSAPALRAGAATEVALSYADDRARLVVGGRTVLSWEDPYGPETTTRGSARLGGRGEVAFRDACVDRDVHYVNGYGSFDPSDHEVEVPPGSYFALGDNSPSSQDGRTWGFLREGHLVGRAFLVFWPFDGARRVR